MSEPRIETQKGLFVIVGLEMRDGSPPPRNLVGPFMFREQAEAALLKAGNQIAKDPWQYTKLTLKRMGILLNGRPIEDIGQENDYEGK